MNLGQRIMVMGNSGGAGKSTLARRLGEQLNLPVVHGDVLGHQLGWVPFPKDEVEQAFFAAAAQPAWVIEGEYRSCAFEYRLERADTMIFLDINVMVCLYRALKRRVSYSSKARPCKPEGTVEQISWQFLSAVLARRTLKRRKTQILARLAEIEPPKQVFHLKGRRAAKNFLAELEQTP
ncbi:MAG: hypothetical protein FWE40_07200 [Oscillospiraceae bacterium]|nr:hypothetical protein [Oscillospiraceae bacterium]